MIRRDFPLGDTSTERWLLVPQTEHARVSGELARAWKGSVNGSEDHLGTPLAAVENELLGALYHHDDGWLGYPKKLLTNADGRPLSFTEMPPHAAQPIWSASIEACCKIGPLAGWVAASHFYALQAKRDDDFPQWAGWLAGVDAERSKWLAEWLGMSSLHSRELADRCLTSLQALDWISLWLCCQCPVSPNDPGPAAPLTVGGDGGPWPAVRFEPVVRMEGSWEVLVEPWPFVVSELRVGVAACSVPASRYDGSKSELTRLEWRLTQK